MPPPPPPLSLSRASSRGNLVLQPVRAATPSRFMITSSASSRLTASRSAGSLLYPPLSPAQKAELDELELRMSQRDQMRERLQAQRQSARQKAVGRGEVFWARRHREDAKRARVHAASERAMCMQPIRFLPTMPEAHALALKSWAKATTIEAAEETAAERKLVASLNDNMSIVSTIINRWQRPSAETAWIQKLKSNVNDHKGFAPQARHFRSLNPPVVNPINVAAIWGGPGAASGAGADGGDSDAGASTAPSTP